MGKRSNFDRIEKDKYATPEEAVIPLIPHLPESFSFSEPCSGNGILVEHIEKLSKGRCYWQSDIEPTSYGIFQMDALNCTSPLLDCDFVITNPPWSRPILHDMIDHFRTKAPTWLLFDADWAHTKQSAPFIPYCSKIVSVGRVRWFSHSKMTGKDNVAWYLFGKDETETVFVGR